MGYQWERMGSVIRGRFGIDVLGNGNEAVSRGPASFRCLPDVRGSIEGPP